MFFMLLRWWIVCCFTQGLFIAVICEAVGRRCRAAYVLYSLLFVESVCYSHIRGYIILFYYFVAMTAYVCYENHSENATLTVTVT